MQALVLERARRLALRDIAVPERLGPRDVRVAIHTVGICGSDVSTITATAASGRSWCANRWCSGTRLPAR